MRQPKSRFIAVLTTLILALSACSYKVDKQAGTNLLLKPTPEMVGKASYSEIYVKVFKPHCVSCHGTSAGVSLETPAAATAAVQKIYQSTIVERRMPKAPYGALTQDELLLLAAWVEAGGPENPRNGEPPANPLPPPEKLEPKFASIKSIIFENKCLSCHSPGKEAARVPLLTIEDLINSPLEIVIPGNPEESGLIITAKEGARKKMPPLNSGISPLKEEEIKIIEEWITNGAKD